jgi:monofunctional glycosyltransferase
MKSILSFVKKLLLWLVVGQLLYIIVCKWIDPPITITQLVNLVQGYGLKRDYIRASEMGEAVKLAVIASEDQLFPDHDGFDVKAIKKAMKYNKKHPNKTRGASTISQQVAKNVFLWQGGGYFRKGLEVYFTFMIEQIWGKKRILEVYLNVAEMGKGVFGVQAAATAYFNKNAAQLTRSEAAMIAATLPNPKIFTIKPMHARVGWRYRQILQQMHNLEGDVDVQEVIK